jgi:soluble lytic murein transglycosylase
MISSLLLAFLLQTQPADAPPPGASPLSPETEAAMDTVRMEMARGRHWHASRRLSVLFPEGPGDDVDLTLLMARAELGWKNWPRVRGLLEGSLAAGKLEGGEAWYLLGRAMEGEGLWSEADSAYTQSLGSEASAEGVDGMEVRVRRSRLRGRLGMYQEALVDIAEVGETGRGMADWVALEVARRASGEGAREVTRLALSLVGENEVRHLGWDLLPASLLAAGDSTGAEAAYWSALPSLSDASDQAEAWDRVGVLRLARGDSSGAKGAFHEVLELPNTGRAGLRAGEHLLVLGFDSVGIALAGARALAAGGRHGDALEAYAEYESLSPSPPPGSVQLARARSHLNLGQGGRALSLLGELVGATEASLAAPALALQVLALRQLGRSGEVRAVQDELVERFPERGEGVEILFNRADALQDRGDREGAIRGYRATVEAATAHNLAGQARMRMGQLFLGMGREEDALEIYLAYQEEFPEGRRWDEAGFWAGRTLLSLDREEEGRETLHRLQAGAPLSYYTVIAGELLGEPFAPGIPEARDTLPFPAFVQEGLAEIDLLKFIGLQEGAEWEAQDLATRLRSDTDLERRQGTLLRLARELNTRGFTREGINLGWELRREGRAWDRDLLAAIYPFPYRELLIEEARDREADPFLMAGLIRQESAFWLEALSRADARGLMQVLPSTGRELARARGITPFRADDHLYVAEINIHLGVAFFVDMRRRFGNDLPIILSAYNAGPTRANRWKEYPEAGDWPLFVERIPFDETRGYVKNVTANRAIFTWLYGGGVGSGGNNLPNS